MCIYQLYHAGICGIYAQAALSYLYPYEWWNNASILVLHSFSDMYDVILGNHIYDHVWSQVVIL